jgi:hypothetical protein
MPKSEKKSIFFKKFQTFPPFYSSYYMEQHNRRPLPSFSSPSSEARCRKPIASLAFFIFAPPEYFMPPGYGIF